MPSASFLAGGLWYPEITGAFCRGASRADNLYLAFRLHRAGQFKEVMSHDGQRQSFVQVLAVAADGLCQKLPVLFSIAAEQSLLPD